MAPKQGRVKNTNTGKRRSAPVDPRSVFDSDLESITSIRGAETPSRQPVRIPRTQPAASGPSSSSSEQTQEPPIQEPAPQQAQTIIGPDQDDPNTFASFTDADRIMVRGAYINQGLPIPLGLRRQPLLSEPPAQAAQQPVEEADPPLALPNRRLPSAPSAPLQTRGQQSAAMNAASEEAAATQIALTRERNLLAASIAERQRILLETAAARAEIENLINERRAIDSENSTLRGDRNAQSTRWGPTSSPLFSAADRVEQSSLLRGSTNITLAQSSLPGSTRPSPAQPRLFGGTRPSYVSGDAIVEATLGAVPLLAPDLGEIVLFLTLAPAALGKVGAIVFVLTQAHSWPEANSDIAYQVVSISQQIAAVRVYNPKGLSDIDYPPMLVFNAATSVYYGNSLLTFTYMEQDLGFAPYQGIPFVGVDTPVVSQPLTPWTSPRATEPATPKSSDPGASHKALEDASDMSAAKLLCRANAKAMSIIAAYGYVSADLAAALLFPLPDYLKRVPWVANSKLFKQAITGRLSGAKAPDQLSLSDILPNGKDNSLEDMTAALRQFALILDLVFYNADHSLEQMMNLFISTVVAVYPEPNLVKLFFPEMACKLLAKLGIYLRSPSSTLTPAADRDDKLREIFSLEFLNHQEEFQRMINRINSSCNWDTGTNTPKSGASKRKEISSSEESSPKKTKTGKANKTPKPPCMGYLSFLTGNSPLDCKAHPRPNCVSFTHLAITKTPKPLLSGQARKYFRIPEIRDDILKKIEEA